MSTINETIAIGKTDRLEIDITSIKYYEGYEYGRNPTWLRLDWGWNELESVGGEEQSNGTLTITEDKLESALRAFLAAKFSMPVGPFRWTWDRYHTAR